MAEAMRFVPIGEVRDIEDAPPQAQVDRQDAERATHMMTMALRALSQRAIVALTSLQAVLLAGSAFWLFMSISANPSVLQLVGAGMYSAFVLAVIGLRR